MNEGTLYQRLLGEDFYLLPPVLQSFHSFPLGGRATGILTVESGRGPLRQTAARLLGLPKPSTNIPIRLEVVVEGKAERWIRRFGSQRIESLQWEENGLLIEQVGSLLFAFDVMATETGMTFAFLNNRIQRWRVPMLLSLGVSATASVLPQTEDRWDVQVKFQSQLLGTLTTYSGTIFPAI